jgi:hypothetical protein
MYNEGIRTYQAGEDLAAHRRVKIEGGTVTTPPEVIYAAAGEQHIGVTEYAVSDGDLVAIRLRTYPGTVEVEGADTFSVNATLYGAADGKVSDTSSGSAIGVAHEACTAGGDLVEMVPFAVLSTTAGAVSIADAGLFTLTATVEAALQEIYQHIASAQAFLNLPLGAWTEQDGTALADFADGASSTPGWSAGDEGFGIRWNNHANPDPISTSVPIPPDLDATADVIVHIMAAKIGATIGDAVTWTIEAFNNADAALYDADADFGGASSAMTGDAATKTCQEETLTLAAANVAGSPCVLTLTLQPTDGLLGTDDVILLGVWLEYTRKILTS